MVRKLTVFSQSLEFSKYFLNQFYGSKTYHSKILDYKMRKNFIKRFMFLFSKIRKFSYIMLLKTQ